MSIPVRLEHVKERAAAFKAQMRLSLVGGLQYRAHYMLTILSVAISAFVEVALWRLVMKSRGQVQGFGLEDLVIYLVVANITSMLCVNWTNVMNFSEEIRSGRISRHLLKPVSLFDIVTGDWLADKIPVLIGTVPVYIALSYFWPVIFHPGLSELFMYLLGLALAYWICAEIYFIILISAFWVSENTGIAIAFNVLRWGFIGSAFPLSFYPDWAVKILEATPLPYLAYYPTLAVMGRMPLKMFLLKSAYAVAMCFALTFFRRVTWHMAEHRLQTVGG